LALWLILAVLVAGAVIAGVLAPRSPAPKREAPNAPTVDDEALWTPDALARLGTPETVADLVAQGRGDELRGLGYDGELPPEE
jgi:hypothetical protein